MNIEYAIIVKNKTRLEALIERFNTKAQAKFYIERSGGNFQEYETEDFNFHNSLSLVQRQISSVVKNKIVERSFLPSFLFNEKQMIIVIGQDGLVANTAKYVNNIPIVAINPDKERYDGVLLPYSPETFIHGVKKVMANDYNTKIATMAEAKLNDGQRILAFNDLFLGTTSHISARYSISFGDRKEEHSSSGIIVSTQSGSTGWLSSVFNMASGIQNSLTHSKGSRLDPNLQTDQLMFAVREPFQSKRTQIDIVAGVLEANSNLTLESHMPNNGIIFSDGIESDFLQFNSGSIATICIAKEKARLVIPD
jgi:NAD kinase